jgi:hypothetical protein
MPFNLNTYRFTALFSFAVLTASAQSRESVVPDKGRWSYRKRFKDERFEGTYVRNHAGEAVSLVSFTRGVIDYRNTEGAQLTLTAPVLPNNSVINISGMNYLMNQPGENFDYRLDMTMLAGSHKAIPLDDAIKPLGIPSTNIGFFGSIREKNQNILVPLWPGADKQNNSQSDWRSDKFLFTLVTHDFIDKVSFTVRTTDGVAVACLASKSTELNIEPDSSLPVVLDGRRLPAGKQWFVLNIQHSGSPRPITYFFYIP